MANGRIASTDHRTQVHTKVRRPIEAVISRAVMFVFGVVEVPIAIRFVFKLLGANAAAGFAKFVHDLSGVSMAPFSTMLKTLSVLGPLSSGALSSRSQSTRSSHGESSPWFAPRVRAGTPRQSSAWSMPRKTTLSFSSHDARLRRWSGHLA